MNALDRSRSGIRDAVEAIKLVRDTCTEPADRTRYDRHHKRLVRAMHDWNRLEELREADLDKEDEA